MQSSTDRHVAELQTVALSWLCGYESCGVAEHTTTAEMCVDFKDQEAVPQNWLDHNDDFHQLSFGHAMQSISKLPKYSWVRPTKEHWMFRGHKGRCWLVKKKHS